jgi:hypothetical protein
MMRGADGSERAAVLSVGDDVAAAGEDEGEGGQALGLARRAGSDRATASLVGGQLLEQ